MGEIGAKAVNFDRDLVIGVDLGLNAPKEPLHERDEDVGWDGVTLSNDPSSGKESVWPHSQGKW